jgi:cytochrome c556
MTQRFLRTATPAALIVAGILYAQTYSPIATNKQIMAAVQKPSMDALSKMLKDGGPKDDAEWAAAETNAAILGESTQLLRMAGRSKDDENWNAKGAERVIAGSQASVAAAKAKDLEALKKGVGQMGSGCRGCHDVHKKKKQQ